MDHKLLTDAAFGADPGRWPLPAARCADGLWLRAVAAGGQGRYASARADLATLRRVAVAGRLASLALSTQASFLRQLGGHVAARGFDGRALALAGDDVEAGHDALLGLAADALGIGRLAASATLLERAGRLAPTLPRQRLRGAWVAAELAMAGGDGDGAVRHAEEAAELASGLESVRHAVKTRLVTAAALCTAGRVSQARTAADEVLAEAGRLGLVPLRWAAASLLEGIGSNTTSEQDVRRIRESTAAAVRHAGGIWDR